MTWVNNYHAQIRNYANLKESCVNNGTNNYFVNLWEVNFITAIIKISLNRPTELSIPTLWQEVSV